MAALLPGQPANAQVDPGAICVSAYADGNANGLRDAGELPLAGVNVNLSTDNVIIATHLTTDSDAAFCFENLAPASYTITFTGSPTYRITTANQGTYALAGGQRLTIDQFGAQPIPPEEWPAQLDALSEQAEPDDKPLDTPVRLVLAMGGSMLVMMFMIAAGAILFGLINRKRRQRYPTATYPPVDRGPNVW